MEMGQGQTWIQWATTLQRVSQQSICAVVAVMLAILVTYTWEVVFLGYNYGCAIIIFSGYLYF